jgi:hypothetical protein
MTDPTKYVTTISRLPYDVAIRVVQETPPKGVEALAALYGAETSSIIPYFYYFILFYIIFMYIVV